MNESFQDQLVGVRDKLIPVPPLPEIKSLDELFPESTPASKNEYQVQESKAPETSDLPPSPAAAALAQKMVEEYHKRKLAEMRANSFVSYAIGSVLGLFAIGGIAMVAKDCVNSSKAPKFHL